MTGPVPRWLAWQIARTLVWSRRMPAPGGWVDSLKDERSDSAWDAAAPG